MVFPMLPYGLSMHYSSGIPPNSFDAALPAVHSVTKLQIQFVCGYKPHVTPFRLMPTDQCKSLLTYPTLLEDKFRTQHMPSIFIEGTRFATNVVPPLPSSLTRPSQNLAPTSALFKQPPSDLAYSARSTLRTRVVLREKSGPYTAPPTLVM